MIEGVQHDEALLVIEDRERSYLIVKGRLDNVVVELDGDGWHQLAAIATEQAIRRELAGGSDDGNVPMVVSMIRRAMRDRGMMPSDGARALRIDRDAFLQVVEGRALMPDALLPQVAAAFGLPWEALVQASQMDRRRFRMLEDVPITISGKLTSRRSNKPVRRTKREGRRHGVVARGRG